MGILKKFTEISRKIVIGYIFYTFPLTLVGLLIFVSYVLPDLPRSDEEVIKVFTEVVAKNPLCIIFGILIFVWTLISLFFSITMFFSKNNREAFLKKLSGIKERDEREVKIVGRALRASYLSTMTILLFLLFINLFYVEYSVKSVDNVESGQPRGSLIFTIGIQPLDSDAIITQKEGYDTYFKYKGSPLSTPTLILILVIWQIVSFRVVSWRASKVPD